MGRLRKLAKDKNVRISISLPPPTHEKLERISTWARKKRSKVVADLIEQAEDNEVPRDPGED